MKKLKYILPVLFILTIFFSSCLKDTPNYIQVSNSAPIIEFGLSPADGDYGPFAYAGDTAGAALIDTQIAVVVASPQVLNSTVSVTVKEDTTQVSAFNNANGTSFTALPDSLFTLTTSASVAPGYRVGNVKVTLNLQKFPASHNFLLPLALVSATAGSTNLIVSSNSGTFMWVFQR